MSSIDSLTLMAVDWAEPPRLLLCAAGELHLWRAQLDLPESRVGALAEILSAEEAARAARFYSPADRRRYVTAHAILRRILGGYLGVSSRRVRLGRTRFGKPLLVAKDDPGLRFNMSHSEGFALYAVTHASDVGVDVESRFRPVRSVMGLMPWTERGRSDSDPMTAWVRREAFLKAVGVGLYGLGRDVDDCRRWTTMTFEPHHGYIAAVTVEGSPMHLRRWEWREEPPPPAE
jgi:4'-phosphopantetheinyl transferase